MQQYLAEYAPHVAIEDVLAQIASPDVKQAYSAVVSGAVGKKTYEEAIRVHRPQLQALFANAFRHNVVDALVIPAIPLTARPVGDDNTIDLNGSQQPTMATIIRNTDPSSNANIPSLCIGAGLAENGLPVGICLEGPAGSDRRLLAIGQAVQDVLGFVSRPHV